MSEQASVADKGKRRWVGYAARALDILILASIGAVFCRPLDPIELELSGPGTSRYVGIIERDGEVYVPCDLGFMWGRFSGTQRVDPRPSV